MLLAWALLALTYVESGLNPFEPSHIDLKGDLAVTAYWIAQSGGWSGVPWIGLVMTGLVISRPGISWRRRRIEASVIGLTLVVLLGGGSYLNEHVIKPKFAVPRPNIVELAKTPTSSPILKMSAAEFYEMPDKASRSDYLKTVLLPDPALDERIRDHWIAETGYSFPSGHSFSAMMVSTFFLAMGLSSFPRRGLWLYYALVLWAVAVCYSRPILRVHSSTDICVGGIQGIVIGVLAFLLVRQILELVPPDPWRGLEEDLLVK